MSKKRYTLYLSRPLAKKFDAVGHRRPGAMSALFEDAMRAILEPEQHPGIDDKLARRLDEVTKSLKTVQRDVAVVTETLALFVRYFLTITPPLPQSEQESARLLGRERFQVFVAQIGRRLATDHRLVSEVLETIADNNPDLFSTATDDAPLKSRAEPSASKSGNGLDPDASLHPNIEEDRHG